MELWASLVKDTMRHKQPNRRSRAWIIGGVLLACVVCGPTVAMWMPTVFGLVPSLPMALVATGYVVSSVGLFKARHLLHERRNRWLRSPWFLAVVCPWLAWWAVSIFLTARLSPEGSDDPVLFFNWLLMSGGFLGAVVCGAIAFRGRTSSEKPLGALAMIPILLLSYPLMFFVLPKVAWLTRRAAFEEMTHRAKPVMAAIESYAADHGELPNDLAALVPGYLEQLPGTGSQAYPGLGYWTSAEGWGFEIQCSRGLGNFDRFYYPPDPARVVHPSDIELINGWAYYHE